MTRVHFLAASLQARVPEGPSCEELTGEVTFADTYGPRTFILGRFGDQERVIAVTGEGFYEPVTKTRLQCYRTTRFGLMPVSWNSVREGDCIAIIGAGMLTESLRYVTESFRLMALEDLIEEECGIARALEEERVERRIETAAA